jgi:hypothetical protein
MINHTTQLRRTYLYFQQTDRLPGFRIIRGDPDDRGNSWQSMYWMMRCSLPEA